MKRAAIYARVSSDDRGRDGRNLAGQLDMGRKYAEEHGWQVVAEMAEDDRGASGAALDLPELSRALEMARDGELDILIVRELDRFARKLTKQLIVEQEFQRHGVRVEYVLGDYPDTPEGRLNKHIRATIAEFEREKINERMTRGRCQKVAAGNVMVHGTPAYGYHQGQADGKHTLVIFEPQARVVRLIFDWYVRGDGSRGPLSIRAITNKLSAACIPSRSDGDPSMTTKRRGRGKWNRTSVRNILRRETYAGLWHYGKRGSKGNTKAENPRETWLAVEVPAIISRETWEAAQEQLKRNICDSPRNLKREYLLRRRAYCGTCGCKLYVNQTNQHRGIYRYYHCPAAGAYRDYATECDQRKRFRADHTDTATWDWVRSLLLHPEATLEGMRQMQASREEVITPLRDRLSAIEGQIVDNERQLARLLDLFLSDDDFPKELLTERKSRLQDTTKRLEQERAELDAEIKSQASSEEQMQTVLQFTERIRDGLEAAEEDFSMRRQIIEVLDLTARMAIEDAEKVVYVKCLMSEDRLSIASTPSRGGSPITQ